jgi:hypothetical protein
MYHILPDKYIIFLMYCTHSIVRDACQKGGQFKFTRVVISKSFFTVSVPFCHFNYSNTLFNVFVSTLVNNKFHNRSRATPSRATLTNRLLGNRMAKMTT